VSCVCAPARAHTHTTTHKHKHTNTAHTAHTTHTTHTNKRNLMSKRSHGKRRAPPHPTPDMPALRHYDYAFKFYGAVKSHKLTVRAVSEASGPARGGRPRAARGCADPSRARGPAPHARHTLTPALRRAFPCLAPRPTPMTHPPT
jgi:hypothetical protein